MTAGPTVMVQTSARTRGVPGMVGRRTILLPNESKLEARRRRQTMAVGIKPDRSHRISPWRSHLPYTQPYVVEQDISVRLGQALGEHPWQNVTPNEVFRPPEVSQVRVSKQWRISQRS